MIKRFFERFRPKPAAKALSAVTSRVDDSDFSGSYGGSHDYSAAQLVDLYNDALTAWRKNPIANRIIAITTDYTIGDAINVYSSNKKVDRFIKEFWEHPENRMEQRLESMVEELCRSGDLFVVLFRDPVSGMSYIRLVTKDRITAINTNGKDWEKEESYIEQRDLGEKIEWIGKDSPRSVEAEAVMCHYCVNRPLGALYGESDLTTMIPWLQRYSRMLEDRVRLHWAMRAFLWIVNVPNNLIREKAEQYRNPPEAGSIIVAGDNEEWRPMSPQLHGADVSHDLEAIRGMVDAGSGYPPHWRGESGQANLATATAMQAPAERHLVRRQKMIIQMVRDLVAVAYQRAAQIGRVRYLSEAELREMIVVESQDLSRSDNEQMARSAREISVAMANLVQNTGTSPDLNRILAKVVYEFSGMEVRDQEIDKLANELGSYHAAKESSVEGA